MNAFAETPYEYRKAYNRQWKRDHPESNAAHQRKWRLANPEKETTTNRFKNAVTAGRIERQPCGVPGCFQDGEAHHDDYRKTYTVRWMCKAHHEARHHGHLDPALIPPEITYIPAGRGKPFRIGYKDSQ